MIFEITNCRPSTHATIKGNFDVSFPEVKLKITECRLVKKKGSEEYFIGFPSHKNQDGSWIHNVFMDDKENTAYQNIIDEAIKGMLEAQRTAS
jgi:hypothetical protein